MYLRKLNNYYQLYLIIRRKISITCLPHGDERLSRSLSSSPKMLVVAEEVASLRGFRVGNEVN
jgi:hypothetical protein